MIQHGPLHLSDVREVMLKDRHTVAYLLQNGWKPLNVCKRVKRLLWWKVVDYSVLFGKSSPGSRSSAGCATPSGRASSTE